MKSGKIPSRMCLGCREMKSKNELVRVVKEPDGNIVLDTTGRKNGRGAYICNSVTCFNRAIKGRCFEKAFGTAIPTEVVADIERRLDGNGGQN